MVRALGGRAHAYNIQSPELDGCVCVSGVRAVKILKPHFFSLFCHILRIFSLSHVSNGGKYFT